MEAVQMNGPLLIHLSPSALSVLVLCVCWRVATRQRLPGVFKCIKCQSCWGAAAPGQHARRTHAVPESMGGRSSASLFCSISRLKLKQIHHIGSVCHLNSFHLGTAFNSFGKHNCSLQLPITSQRYLSRIGAPPSTFQSAFPFPQWRLL